MEVILCVEEADGSDGSILERFLDFVANDIEQRPSAIKVLPSDLAERTVALTDGMDADFDTPIEGDVAL